MTVIATFFADAHVDVSNWASHSRLRGDSMWSLSYIFDKSVAIGASDVICAGDFFDEKDPPSEAVTHTRLEIDKLADKRINFYFVQGQHDMVAPPWLNAIHDWPSHLHENVATLRNRERVHGLDWLPANRLQGALEAVPPVADIFVGHQVWEDFMGDNVVCEGHFGLVKHATRIFTGDFHKRVHWLPEDSGLLGGSGQRLEIVSAGSTNMRSIIEDRAKYFAAYHDDGAWSFIKIPTRLVFEREIRDSSGMDSLIEDWDAVTGRLVRLAVKRKLPEQLRKPIIYIRYSDTVPDAPSRIDKLVGDFGFTFYKCVESSAEEEAEGVVAERREMLKRGLSGCLGLVLDKEDPRYVPLSSLLNSADPLATIRSLRADFLTTEDGHVTEEDRGQKLLST